MNLSFSPSTPPPLTPSYRQINSLSSKTIFSSYSPILYNLLHFSYPPILSNLLHSFYPLISSQPTYYILPLRQSSPSYFIHPIHQSSPSYFILPIHQSSPFYLISPILLFSNPLHLTPFFPILRSILYKYRVSHETWHLRNSYF